MAEFPSKVSTRTSSPAQGAAAGAALRPDLAFARSSLGALMLLQLVSTPLKGAGTAGVGPDCRHPVPPVPGLRLGDVRRRLHLAGDNRPLHPLPVSAAHEVVHGALAAGVNDLECWRHCSLHHCLHHLLCGSRADVPEGQPGLQPACSRLLLCVFSDDCLWSKCLLQLPGLARRGQQCGHQSDGRWLRLDPVSSPPWSGRLQPGSRAGSPTSTRPGCCGKLAWQGDCPGSPPCSPRGTLTTRGSRTLPLGLAQVGAHMGWRQMTAEISAPPYSAESDGERFSVSLLGPGRPLLTSTKCTNKTPQTCSPGKHALRLTSSMCLSSLFQES